MQHFFVTPEQVGDGEILIQGSDVNHMKNVLRMKLGEVVEINDGNNRKYIGKIIAMNENEICVSIIEELQSDTELSSKIYLFQGLPKADKMELIVQKAVELGVVEVIPVTTQRTVVKLDDKKKAKKVERWNSIAESAAKQSARGVIPSVAPIATWKQALEYAQNMDHVIVPYELAEGMAQTRATLESIKRGESIAIFIGPEGGFDKNEIQCVEELGMKPITLGRRILRTETAGLATLAMLVYLLEE